MSLILSNDFETIQEIRIRTNTLSFLKGPIEILALIAKHSDSQFDLAHTKLILGKKLIRTPNNWNWI